MYKILLLKVQLVEQLKIYQLSRLQMKLNLMGKIIFLHYLKKTGEVIIKDMVL